MRTIMSFYRRTARLNLPRLAALLALVALVFHGLLPLTQQIVRQAQAANGIEQIVLCSALGLRSIAMKDGAPVDTDPAKTEKTSKLCPVCFAAAGHDHALLPVTVPPDLPVLAITVLYGAAPASTLASASVRPPQARAPPALVS